jgi:N-acetylglucosamine-6-phosphate deacetylase
MTFYHLAITHKEGRGTMDNNTGREVLFINARIYTPNRTIENGYLRVNHGVIEEVDHQYNLDLIEMNTNVGVTIIDLKGKQLIPGFIDIHVHGGGGFDVMSGNPEDINGMSIYHASKGTTTFLATTLTATPEAIKKALKAIKKSMEEGTTGASVAGVHLEGPFLNPERCGAQNPAHICAPSLEALRLYQECSGGNIALITVAPEMPGAMELIRYAVDQGMTVSIGHSAALFECVQQAVKLGASQITHLFNGMNPLHHREPGVPGAGLILDELAVELICDHIHVHPDLISLVLRAKPTDKVLFITDCMSASGLAEGSYHLGDLPVIMKDGQVRLLNNDGSVGSLAGSCLTMDMALLNAMKATSATLEALLPALTINPARQVGLHTHKGSIETGKDADLVVLDETYQVVATFVKGRNVYTRE